MKRLGEVRVLCFKTSSLEDNKSNPDHSQDLHRQLAATAWRVGVSRGVIGSVTDTIAGFRHSSSVPSAYRGLTPLHQFIS
ncbi:hypothetical protein J6590_047663 [Homalodisca vitripennis]|nr:hypothetical protein J6590_047663 [Homalodisca vitripennis]